MSSRSNEPIQDRFEKGKQRDRVKDHLRDRETGGESKKHESESAKARESDELKQHRLLILFKM